MSDLVAITAIVMLSLHALATGSATVTYLGRIVDLIVLLFCLARVV